MFNKRRMSFLLTVEAGLSKVLPCSRDRHKLPDREPVILALATTLALGAVSGACKDPNPTFVFDASSDGAKDAVTDGAGSADASGGDEWGRWQRPEAAGAAAPLVPLAVGAGAPLPGRAGSPGEPPGAAGRAARPGPEVRRDSLYETNRLRCRPDALGGGPRPDAAARGSGSRRIQPPAPRRPRPHRPAPPAPAAAPDVAAPAASPAPAGPDTARLDEIEQTARIALRKHELLEEEAAKRAKEAPKVTVDDKGFGLALPDKSYVLKIRGLLQTDGRFFFDDQALQANNTFLIRRFRPTLEGTLFSLVDYPDDARVRRDGDRSSTPTSTFIRWEWLRVRAGKMKGPVGLERLQSDADLALLERALDQNLSSQRDVGVQLWGDIAGGIVHYVAGVFNGDPDTTAADMDINYAKDFAGRLFFRPFRTEGLRDFGNLGVGLSAQTGNRKRPPADQHRARPDRPRAVQDRRSEHVLPVPGPRDRHDRRDDDVHARAGDPPQPAALLLLRAVRRARRVRVAAAGRPMGNTTTQLTQQAAHVTASFTIGGTEDYDGATPEHGFDPARALPGRAAARRSVRAGSGSTTRPSRPTRTRSPARARRRRSAAAPNWVLRRSFRVGLLYEQTWFDGGAGTAATATTPAVIANRPTEYLLQGRAQVNF